MVMTMAIVLANYAQEFDRCVTAQLRPGDDTELDFNERLCESPLLPDFTPEFRAQMTQTTLIGGHANFMNRCYHCGVACGHKDHSNESGVMCMAFLREHDDRWARAIETGSETTILRWQVRDHPEAMSTIILADNAKHGANLVEHYLQMVRRLAHWCRAEETITGQVNKHALINKLLRTAPTCN